MSDTRDQLRAKLLATRQPSKKVIPFLGGDIEIRQPRLKDVLNARDNPDQQGAMLSMLIDYAYVPKTEEKVFESGDAEALLEMPFGEDFAKLADAISELTNVNFPKQSTDSSKTQSSSPS